MITKPNEPFTQFAELERISDGGFNPNLTGPYQPEYREFSQKYPEHGDLSMSVMTLAALVVGTAVVMEQRGMIRDRKIIEPGSISHNSGKQAGLYNSAL